MMSFWSSLNLVRAAAPPPVVTVDAIGRFVSDLAATGALADDEEPLCQIKYGPRVDADEQTTDIVEWDERRIIGTVREYPWDLSVTYPSLAALSEVLAKDGRQVYRAYLSLGGLSPEIVAALTREPSEQNEIGLCLYALSFSVGPVIVAGLGSDSPALVGWMGLELSGPGYYFPWDFREGRERAEAIGSVQRLVAACRGAWPVPPEQASVDLVAARRQAAELWLYDDFAMPPDWLWFASEA
jgi:hypothetical protein